MSKINHAAIDTLLNNLDPSKPFMVTIPETGEQVQTTVYDWARYLYLTLNPISKIKLQHFGVFFKMLLESNFKGQNIQPHIAALEGFGLPKQLSLELIGRDLNIVIKSGDNQIAAILDVPSLSQRLSVLKSLAALSEELHPIATLVVGDIRIDGDLDTGEISVKLLNMPDTEEVTPNADGPVT